MSEHDLKGDEFTGVAIQCFGMCATQNAFWVAQQLKGYMHLYLDLLPIN